jgi:FeS assembly SUF system protein
MALSKLFKSKKTEASPAAQASQNQMPPPAEAQPVRIFSPDEIREAVIEALRTVYDPEIPVNIYEMGLIYDVDVDAAGKVVVTMTLTSPGCPVAGSLLPEVERKALMIPGVSDARAILVWDPPWDPNMMSEAAKLQLGLL